MPDSSWLGKIRGHVSQARERFSKDAREREAAGRLPRSQNIILTEKEVRGDWDASRILMTTLGGEPRPITANDLAAFRQNIRTAQRKFGARAGITARQIIDLASGRPLGYTSPDGSYRSDIDKARREITSAIPLSAVNGTIRFATNAGPNSKVNRHYVTVNLLEFESAAAKLAATEKKDKQTPKQVANWLRKQKLAFDCDCERHRYFFRYVATIGGFAAGRKETGYPKIRNPKLQGVACKHVLRVMTELESSNTVLRFLENHLQRVSEYKSRTAMTQKQAEKILKEKKRTTTIKTSAQRKAEAEKRRAAYAAKNAVKRDAKKVQKAPKSPATKRATAQKELQSMMERLGLTPEQIIAILQGGKS